jgi:hypothetical protein
MWLCRKLAPSQLFAASAGTTLYCVRSIIDIHIFSHPSLFASSLSPLLLELEEFSKSEKPPGRVGTEFRTWACLTAVPLLSYVPVLSFVSYAPPLNYTSAVGATLRLELQRTLLSYTSYSSQLRRTLSSYALYYYELRRTLLSYATPFRDTPNYS